MISPVSMQLFDTADTDAQQLNFAWVVEGKARVLLGLTMVRPMQKKSHIMQSFKEFHFCMGAISGHH